MKERPILFSAAMVNAILEGRKTQTWRVIKPQPEGVFFGPEIYTSIIIDRYGEMTPGADEFGIYGDDWSIKCPHGRPGDHLWVRETWRAEELESGLDGIRYRADDSFRAIQNTRAASDLWMDAARAGDPWRPSIFMPRWASRITLEVTGWRAVRVQDISYEDALAEGTPGAWIENSEYPGGYRKNPNRNYAAFSKILWDSIYKKRGYGWDVNPWAWAGDFNVL